MGQNVKKQERTFSGGTNVLHVDQNGVYYIGVYIFNKAHQTVQVKRYILSYVNYTPKS